ncbi:hypothetical protein VCSRO151_2869 [Vibrio cholerae]|uniref:EpsG family protein n=1 Tax=Vibrio TaxID=662 RepID=UPI000A10A1FE|nr:MULTISPECIES: EpsG family protein [Vibrio]EGR4261616.1 EpsG family protein [Vibrio cholerae]ORP25550.1 hypothetical protein B7953_02540 [Vibrio paracholerae]TXX92816.1 EpsG family protein [Vibrio cholerae]BCN18146.1 putative O-antigen polymerase [Vibrio cholerae]GHW44149.1 hypothetical protein VCSRO151_2869 [Vibrio cholerae]
MIPYIVVLLLLIFSALLLDYSKLKWAAFYVNCTILWLFCALRGNGDGDYFTYIEYSKLITTTSDIFDFAFPMEIGFRILSFFCNQVGLGSQSIIIAMATFSLLPTYFTISKISHLPSLSLLVFFPFFLMMDMHSSRTAIAASFGLIGAIEVFKGRSIKGTMLVIFGSAFHSSALILVWLLSIFWLRSALLLFVFVFFLAFQIVFDIRDVLIFVLQTIGLDFFVMKAQIYFSQEEYVYPIPLYDPRILLQLLVTVLIVNYSQSLGKENKNYKLINMYIFGGIILVAFSDMTIFSIRLSYFFLISSFLVIPIVAERLNRNFKSCNLPNLSGSMIFCFIYTLMSSAIIYSYVDYKLFFE